MGGYAGPTMTTKCPRCGKRAMVLLDDGQGGVWVSTGFKADGSEYTPGAINCPHCKGHWTEVPEGGGPGSVAVYVDGPGRA